MTEATTGEVIEATFTRLNDALDHIYRASELVWAADELSGENLESEAEYENIDRMHKIITLASAHTDAGESILSLVQTGLDAEAWSAEYGDEN